MSVEIVLSSTVLFLLGAMVASFVGVVAGRLHTGQSFVRGRSRCDACARPLSLYALVPLISFAASRGRAQCCGATISWLAPFTELLLGALFVLAYLSLGLSFALFAMLVTLALLLALVLYDLAHQILPLPLLAPFIVLAALTGYLAASSLASFITVVETAVVLALGIAAIHFATRGRAMGFADAPFVFGCALFAGPAALAGLVFSFWIGAVVGIALLARRPRGSRMGVEVPFAPFLAAGFLLAYFTQWNPFLFIALASTRFIGLA